MLMNFKDFAKELSSYNPENLIFVGLGNELCGDDAAGLVFLDKLEEFPDFAGSCFITARTNPENYLQKILDSKGRVVVFIDAARSGGKPGAISWIDPHHIDRLSISTHAFSLKMVELYLMNNRRFIFKYLGIEPLSTNKGDHLSSKILTHITAFFTNG